MPAKAYAESAITGLNEKELKGRTLNVNEARPRSGSRRSGRDPYGVSRGEEKTVVDAWEVGGDLGRLALGITV